MVITWRVVHTFDLGEVLRLRGVPTTNVDYFVQGWTK
jgi:hypothetical protein